MKHEVHFESESDRLRPGKSEVERLYCNNEKIIEYTSWKPKYTLQTGLRKTIEWLQENINQYKPNQYTI
jgi:dTDP-D-glucose 4,6-dehydratase